MSSLLKVIPAASSRALRRNLASVAALDISGIFPPTATPFKENEEIDFSKLEENMEKWNKIPFKGYVVHGSNGEYPFLSGEEKIQLVRETKKMAAPGKVIIAGAGCEATKDTIQMCKSMAEAGAEAVMVVNPYFYKANMTPASLITHFTKVADSSPLPVILYNVPSNTGVDIPVDVVVTLAAHPNIIGLKDSGGDITRIATIVAKTQGFGFQILAGSAGFLLPAYNVGCVGGICGAANVLGEEVCRLWQLSQSGDLMAAQELQLRLVGPNTCVTRRFGVPGLKAAMDWLGYYGGPTRRPMQPLSQSELEAMREEFAKSGFLP